MKRAMWLGLAVMALFTSLAAVSTSAFGLALPENLPVSAKARKWKGEQEGKESVLKAGATETKCTAAHAEGEEEAGKPLGPFHIRFLGCTSLVGDCVGAGDSEANKEILALGTWHLVWDEKGKIFEKLTTAVLFLIEKLHFTCGGGLVLILVSGEVLCLHKEPTVKAFTHLFECGGAANKEDNWCKEDKVVGGVDKCEGLVKPVLSVNINEAKNNVEGEEVAKGSATYEEEIFADI